MTVKDSVSDSSSSTLVSTAMGFVERALEKGATDVEVYIRKGRESEVEVRNGSVDTLVEGLPSSVGIRIWSGARSSTAMATQLSEETMDPLIDNTLERAAFSDPVAEQSLASRDLLTSSSPSIDLHDAQVSEQRVDDIVDRLLRLESEAMKRDERLSVSGGCRYGDYDMEHALATSRGCQLGYRETITSTYLEVIANDKGGKKRNGGWFDIARHLEDRLDDETLINRTVERAVGHLGASTMTTGVRPVVFDPYAAAALLRTFFSVLKGAAVEQGNSFLLDCVGKKIADERVVLVDEPLLKRGIGSRPFDGEGLPSKRHVFVDQGVLKSFALNTYHANKLGMKPTGHASRPVSGAPGESSSNLHLQPGSSTPEALIGDIEDGFYCESMMGFGFNPATGDFSRGASGYRIEGGRLTTPVSEVTVSQNMSDILMNISGISNDLRMDRSISSPHIRVDGMTIGGE